MRHAEHGQRLAAASHLDARVSSRCWAHLSALTIVDVAESGLRGSTSMGIVKKVGTSEYTTDGASAATDRALTAAGVPLREGVLAALAMG